MDKGEIRMKCLEIAGQTERNPLHRAVLADRYFGLAMGRYPKTDDIRRAFALFESGSKPDEINRALGAVHGIAPPDEALFEDSKPHRANG